MPTPSTPYYTDDQWASMMKLQDLTGQEQQIARQQAMAKDLREGGGAHHIDKASQIAQGLRGINSAVLDYKNFKDSQQLSADRKNWVDLLTQQRRQNLPIAPPSVNNYDPSQFNDQTGQYGGG